VGSWFPLIPLKRVPLRAGGDTRFGRGRDGSKNTSADYSSGRRSVISLREL